MSPASLAVAGVLLLGVAAHAWVRWGERRATRFVEVTHEPMEGEG